MAGNKKITFSVSSEKHKDYLKQIAREKGYGKISTMSRVALQQMITRMKLPFTPPT